MADLPDTSPAPPSSDTLHEGPPKRTRAPPTRAGTGRGRRSLGPSAAAAAAAAVPESLTALDLDDLEVSEDTDGSMPQSPVGGFFLGPGGLHLAGAGLDEEEKSVIEPQVTVCRWDACDVGDLGNMDLLVSHIHDDHIQNKQKRYSCEWEGCARKGYSHASAYALKAHMRSHTKEKPFYCSLPECDRAFTRSDALAKHMRTVHDTDAPKVSELVSRVPSVSPMPGGLAISDLKQTRGKAGQLLGSPAPGEADAAANDNVIYKPISPTRLQEIREQRPESLEEEDGLLLERTFPTDVQFTAEELALPPDRLYRRLQAQLQWASSVQSDLLEDIKALTESEHVEWAKKEVTLDRVMESELTWHENRLSRKRKLDDPLTRRTVNGMRADLRLPPLSQAESKNSGATLELPSSGS